MGYVEAHEIGHLLLGPNSHSACGVKRGRWSAEDLREIELGQMVFLAERAKVMQKQVEERGGRSY